MSAARHVPVALYTIGLCHYGAKTPFKTVEVAADSARLAMTQAWIALQPSHIQTVHHVSRRPNPAHAEAMAALAAVH